MKSRLVRGSVAAIFFAVCAVHAQSSQLPAYKDAGLPVEARVQDLLKRMTLEEMAAQLSVRSASQLLDNGKPALKDGQIDPERLEKVFGGLGWGMLECPYGGDIKSVPLLFNASQRYMVEHTRLGIPTIPYCETLHGVLLHGATIYPQSIAVASTWNRDLTKRMASEIADEASAVGIRQAMAPVADVIRDLRWGRVEESFGEDTYLVSQLAVAYTIGLQGPPDKTRHGIDLRHIGGMAKGYVGHGFPQSGLNLAPISMSELELRSIPLPPYEAAVKQANVYSIMPVYNEVNGLPAHGDPWLINHLLRDEMGFRGYVFSDYLGIEMMASFHQWVPDNAAAAQRAITAGVDIDAPDGSAYEHIPELVREGRLSRDSVERAVADVLRAKFLLGVFEHPYVDSAMGLQHVHTPEHIATARAIAEESIVLLKNDNRTLPIDATKIKSIAVIGPNADQVNFGDYSATKDNRDGITLLQGIRALAPSTVTVRYAKGCSLLGSNKEGFRAALDAAAKSDVVIVAVGETSMPLQGVGWLTEAEDFRHATSGEGYDRTSLDLTGVQEGLVESIHRLGKPMVVVLINGRPQTIPWMKQNVPAIVEAWYPGEQGGHAIAEVLFGKVNSSGRLPISFPVNVGQLPVNYNHDPSAKGYYHRPGGAENPGRDYVDASPEPLFPFGFGLSYTSFQYSDLRLSVDKGDPQPRMIVSLRVRNAGESEGKEVVQLYLRRIFASRPTPVMELKGFDKVSLKPGESTRVSLALTWSELSMINLQMKREVEDGEIEVMVGASSSDIRLRARFAVANGKPIAVMSAGQAQ